MKQEKKQMYVAPAIEVIKMENEGVIAASGGSLGDLIDGGSAFSTGRSGYLGSSVFPILWIQVSSCWSWGSPNFRFRR